MHRSSGVVAEEAAGPAAKPTAKPVPRTRQKLSKPEGPLKKRQAAAEAGGKAVAAPSVSQLRRAAHKASLEEGILAVARQMLVEQGPEALTLREVAAAVGYSHATLYAFFADKNALLARLGADARLALEDTLAAQSASMTPDAAERRDPLLPLGRVLAAYVRWAQAHAHLFRLLAAGDELQQLMPPLLAERLAAVPLAPRWRDPGLLAQTLWAAAHGVALLALQQPGLSDLDARIDALLALCRAGVSQAE
ncbi:helix-turn-helix domain-containing protein [Paucibacter sp. APW11]|uniref:Helix-turn-helix domain-containing protein n=1 Tax=Roseateles aquae TaxID=3077235 RepID=A0ABU3PIG9_9BURK|nr:helix-turn-helix domain-containing protein [Paucibacter sp. APW11]MDT9002366.1 helix-turn-helix domain-containing protein [Paucibacter sp. APW11]